MPNPFFQFKQFNISQSKSAMKVTTDGCLFGAWAGGKLKSQNLKVKNALDLGAGTGLLTLMLAQQINADFDAIEIDPEAAAEATDNFHSSPWNDRLTIINADVRKFGFTSKYDLIISNPPFHENSLKSGNAKKDSAHHDDSLLLKDLIALIALHLQPEGQFYLLLPFQRLAELESLIGENKLQIMQLTGVRQKSGSSFFRIMICGKLLSDLAPYENNELTIKGSDNEYTKEFINLLRDYYLYLDS